MAVLNRRAIAFLMPGLLCMYMACTPPAPTIILKVDKQLPVSDAAELSRGLLEGKAGTVHKGDSDQVARYYSVQLNKGIQLNNNASIVLDYPLVGTSPYFRVADNGNGRPVKDGDTIAVTKVQPMKLKGPEVEQITQALRTLADTLDAHKENSKMTVSPAMDSMMTAFARKDADWIVAHSSFPFQISIGLAVDAEAITDPAVLKKALTRLFRERYFEKILNQESIVDSLRVTYLSKFYNKQGEFEGESGWSFVFTTGAAKQLLLQQIFLAG